MGKIFTLKSIIQQTYQLSVLISITEAKNLFWDIGYSTLLNHLTPTMSSTFRCVHIDIPIYMPKYTYIHLYLQNYTHYDLHVDVFFEISIKLSVFGRCFPQHLDDFIDSLLNSTWESHMESLHPIMQVDLHMQYISYNVSAFLCIHLYRFSLHINIYIYPGYVLIIFILSQKKIPYHYDMYQKKMIN